MKKTTKILMALCIISLVITGLLYTKLPDTIPAHFNIEGEVDAYGSKIMVFVIGTLPLLFLILMAVLPKVDPKRKNYHKFSKTYDIFKVVIVMLFLSIHWIILLNALNILKNINMSLTFAMSIVSIVMGNYMPKVKHNYFLGVKTPWTLASEYTWEKTHRLAGYLFIVSGVISLLIVFILPKLALYALLWMLIVSSIICALYSYVVFKQHEVS